MHLLLPFASAVSEASSHVLRDLALPHLTRLLALLAPGRRDSGDAYTLSPPHERALAEAWGWRGGDGLLPFGAQAAFDDGVPVGDLAWGLLTPAHWHVGRDHVSLADPAVLNLDEAEASASRSPGAHRSAGTPPTTAWPTWPAHRSTGSSAATSSCGCTPAAARIRRRG